MPKTHTPYSFFDIAEFLQTRMQNARDERVAARDAKSPYSIGFFGESRRSASYAEGRPGSSLVKKPYRIRVFSPCALRLRASRILHSRLQKLGNVEKAIWGMGFVRAPVMHTPCKMH
jgi:hypothetical protein